MIFIFLRPSNMSSKDRGRLVSIIPSPIKIFVIPQMHLTTFLVCSLFVGLSDRSHKIYIAVSYCIPLLKNSATLFFILDCFFFSFFFRNNWAGVFSPYLNNVRIKSRRNVGRKLVYMFLCSKDEEIKLIETAMFGKE